MAHSLIRLLGGSTAEHLALQELRAMTRDGVDVRLVADILAKAHTVMRQLGLDPADTTAQEVYNALVNAVRSEQWIALLDETDYVLVDIDGEIISFNAFDVIENFHHELPLQQRHTSAAKRGLGYEITRRYKEHPSTVDTNVARTAGRAKWPTEQPPFCRVEFGKPSVLVIGDIASETLLTLDKQYATASGSKNERKLAIDLGAEVSCENSETQDATGGAANAAVAFARLGIQPSLMSWLGSDTVGKQSRAYLRSHGVDMSGVVTEKQRRTNHHYVLRHGVERTILANYEQFYYAWQEPACRPDWVYVSSISDDSWLVHEGLIAYLAKNESVKLAFQVGPAHLGWGVKRLKPLYERAEVLVLNVDEAMVLTGKETRGLSTLAKELHKLGPKQVVLTDGPRGAFVYDGEHEWRVPAYPDPQSPVDRTGAGDAFAATLVAELAKGSELKDALLRAPINSMSVLQYVGAQAGLLYQKDIDEYLGNAPEEYNLS